MIAKEVRIILIPLLLVTFPLGVYAQSSGNKLLIILYTILGLLFLFCLNFFRDPTRSIPVDKTIVVSPADGKVLTATDSAGNSQWETVEAGTTLGKAIAMALVF